MGYSLYNLKILKMNYENKFRTLIIKVHKDRYR